jgi:DNA-binding CsgD family transcriptional regulator
VIAGARPQRVALARVDSLTPSERRVVDLAAQGLSNRQIAETLFVTLTTVEVHLGRAYGKLGIKGRTQLAAALAAPSPESRSADASPPSRAGPREPTDSSGRKEPPPAADTSSSTNRPFRGARRDSGNGQLTRVDVPRLQPGRASPRQSDVRGFAHHPPKRCACVLWPVQGPYEAFAARPAAARDEHARLRPCRRP